MTTPQIVLEGSPASEDEWNEAQLATSLAHLQLLHTQLRELRETIPSLIKSVHADYLSPEGLYNEFAQSATTAVNNVKAFTKLMRDTETKAIMQRAEESRLQNAEGIMAWLVTQHDDWLDKSVEDNVRELRLTSEEVKDEDPGNGTNTEELRLLLKKFQDDHVEVEASLNEEDQKIEIRIPPPIPITCLIDLKSKTPAHPTYNVTSVQKSKSHASIIQAITKDAKGDSLSYLLDMLASYSDLTGRPCHKCSTLVDSRGDFPVIRIRKKTQGPGGEHVTRWDALHPNCV